MAIICTNIPLFFSSRKILTLFLSTIQAIVFIKTWLTPIRPRIEISQASNYYSSVKRWVSPAPPAAIQRWRQSHDTAPESGANRHRPNIHIPTAARRRCPRPDSPYSYERSREPTEPNPPPAGFAAASPRRRSVAALRPYTRR